MNTKAVTIQEIEPTLLEEDMLNGSFETNENSTFLTAIESLSGALGTPKEFLQKLDATDDNDWQSQLCRGILEKYYEEDIY